MSGAPRDAVLALNAGSSSLKFGVYERQGPALWTGLFEGLEPGGTPSWHLAGETARALLPAPGQDGFAAALDALLALLAARGRRLAAVAHRVVHGGERCVAPCVLDAELLAYLHTLEPLAPLHQPHNLAGVAAIHRAQPALPQLACFDTAFHASMPEVERRLPLPRDFESRGLRRYGFHGLSYESVAGTLATVSPRAGGRLLMAHLGNGASLCGAIGGRSVASSMGLSALDGLMMGTRSGALDPGVLLYLWRDGWTLEQVERLLYKQSGLLGVSGLSADMRTLRASAEPAAAEAIALFTHRLLREAGAIVAVLGGLELLAFTGGIGEHDAQLREDVAAGLGFTGLVLDPAANRAAPPDRPVPVHAAGSAVEVWVVPTDEGRVAADAAFRHLDAA
ncbi:acetate/propionate family kinase [Rubrivivax gelatinosus]|uniref:Acetate kinase n=1 Tax=Rubrivivax gelatinosus (strain NBRC 100245 / IL144) TaxID=983917 RepID=I0HL47_RUBGI|nr:acetate/propionate family kinase [Rubrivivax gelatinosus]BAL93734.1 acetate kinase AckA [Rubrivivax gelatinosus IL144]